jgi:hypothetical protein
MLSIKKFIENKNIRQKTVFTFSNGIGLWQIDGGLNDTEMETKYPIQGIVYNRQNKLFYKGENPDKTKI